LILDASRMMMTKPAISS